MDLVCNKKLYAYRSSALKARKKIFKLNHNKDDNYSAYFCKPCNGWHLTSISTKRNKSIKKEKRNKIKIKPHQVNGLSL